TALARLSLLPATEKKLYFLVTPDQRRLHGAQGLEPACGAALTKTCQARCASENPASCCSPRSSSSNNSPICSRVLAAITRVDGVASACSRAARLGVSPTTDCSCAEPSPITSPTITNPVAAPTRA